MKGLVEVGSIIKEEANIVLEEVACIELVEVACIMVEEASMQQASNQQVSTKEVDQQPFHHHHLQILLDHFLHMDYQFLFYQYNS